MLFALRFTNKAGITERYQQLMAEHVRWLEANRSTVLVAGALRPGPEALPIGALWIVEAPSMAQVQKVYQSDPFWVEGLRESVEVLHWSKAVLDRQALL